ncbi:uncharacterized protein LOC105287218 [Ooceraea biroi]|uniref:uncharacterized protein LOC105287218 n=1 Tax=Ooceraea biroi TaxID=2015173 RepID=UPI0005BE0ABF|nr:uncharacterized protein LOC105287218 [Ooceraea biroi]
MALEILGKGITKFDGSDFQTWKFDIKQLLITHGLEDVVDGTRERPAGDGANAAVKAWIKDNAKAMSLIALSIYEHRSASGKLLLLQRYHEYRMKPEDSVIQHVTNVQKLASQLKDAGQEVNETDIMAKILGSLPPKYSTLATAWDSVPIAEQSVGVLLERLIKEENRMSEEDSAASALAA